jgi:3-oxoacyl-[acyl-carrier-protein] synthase II
VKALAVTGLGVVSPIGTGRDKFVKALGDHRAARAVAFGNTPTVLKVEVVPNAIAAEVWGFDATEYLGKKGLRNFDRLTRFLIVAAKLALEDAGLKKDGVHLTITGDRIGVCSATAYGSLDSITELMLVSELEDPRYLNPGRFPNTVINAAAAYVSIWEDLRAPNTTVVDGNCGALDAVLTCENHLANGRADAFLVGGGEILSEPLYLAFRRLGVLAEGSAEYAPGRPESGGMRIGEGAAYVCIERVTEAIARGATIRAEIVGYGNAFEPPPSEAILVHASQIAVQRAVTMALQDASIQPSEIDAVCTSANGMQPFDRAEIEAIHSILGQDVALIAPKGIYGETLGASGALGMATVLAWFEGASPEPLVNGRAPERVSKALVVTVGFYGNVSAMVMRRYEAGDSSPGRPGAPHE